jgi:endonuclease V-like protein UPF0215 family
MTRLHLNKRGMRVLGIAESFRQTQAKALIAGVVMRGDSVIDGLEFGNTTVGGDDATSSIAGLYRRLRRNDVNLLMLSGCIISKYNIVDIDALAKAVDRPVVCLTYNETAGIESLLKKRFPGAPGKLAAYRKLGARRPLKLSTGHIVYVRCSGVGTAEAETVVVMFTLQGSIPEPVRVAKLLARAGARRFSRRGSSATPGRRSL